LEGTPLPRGPFDLFFLDSGGFKEASDEIGPVAIGLRLRQQE
jgi:hypothetical protein